MWPLYLIRQDTFIEKVINSGMSYQFVQLLFSPMKPASLYLKHTLFSHETCATNPVRRVAGLSVSTSAERAANQFSSQLMRHSIM